MKPLILTLALGLLSSCATKQTHVYYGTYTGGSSEGIYFSTLDTKTGYISEPELAVEVENPSFVAFHPSKKYLFAVVEFGDEKAAVNSYSINEDGTLTFISSQPAKGAYPCYVSTDKTGQVLFISNWGGGNIASLPIAKDGSLGDGHYYDLAGKAKNSNGHAMHVDNENNYALAIDLGMDQIVSYTFDKKTAKLKKHATFNTPTKGGPRHFAFHPNGKFAYSNLEHTREVIAMTYDQKNGTLKQIQKLSTLPKNAPATGSTAECLLHPSGKFLYISNRGHDSIAVYSVDQKTGLLTLVEITKTQGKIPRGFGIDPSGKFLIVGHQKSDAINVFAIDQSTGSLKFTGHSQKLNAAVNVRFLEKQALTY